jgi:type III pantothenate kinase
MELLFIDIGNSKLKIAQKSERQWDYLLKADNGTAAAETEKFLKDRSYDHLIICSVREDILDLVKSYVPDNRCTVLTHDLIPEGNLHYSTPKTLGMDRYLSCFGAHGYSQTHVITVDTGTACTIDLMTADGVYRGGVIMPGLALFHKMVEQGLPELPAVPRKLPLEWPGGSTRESLEWGINGGYLMAVNGFVEKYDSGLEGEVTLYITGGDSEFLNHHLNPAIEMHYHPFLVFEGMFRFWETLNS